MNVSPVANAVSAAIVQQSQAATAASVAALTANVNGTAPISTPAPPVSGSTSLLNVTA